MLETQKLGVDTNAGDPKLEITLMLETQKLGVGTNAGDPEAWSWH